MSAVPWTAIVCDGPMCSAVFRPDPAQPRKAIGVTGARVSAQAAGWRLVQEQRPRRGPVRLDLCPECGPKWDPWRAAP